jgi:GH15 family glucan-1,4-alpha-glucosidase
VGRSALLLKSLCHRRTGSIMAAGTTSLPEVLGGTRNWDYRMCWPRDASMIASALVRLGSLEEAESFLAWLAARVARLGSPEQLRPVYPLEGEGIREEELPNLPGYRGSTPVRIGNAAEHQVQMDVFGPIVELVETMIEAGAELDDARWWLVCQMVEAVARHWQEPDFGIWEERRPTRQHVLSKVMCWQTVDRALAIAERSGRTPGPNWSVLRTAIRSEVLERGWNPDASAFTMAYGENDLDAAVLHLGLSGLLDPHDERFSATLTRIEEVLMEGPTVYRYALDDGHRESEGGFFLCAAWLAECLWRADRFEEGTRLFESCVALEGPTGLIPEQYDPELGICLGNVPQGYSHLGLINLALEADRLGLAVGSAGVA